MSLSVFKKKVKSQKFYNKITFGVYSYGAKVTSTATGFEEVGSPPIVNCEGPKGDVLFYHFNNISTKQWHFLKDSLARSAFGGTCHLFLVQNRIALKTLHAVASPNVIFRRETTADFFGASTQVKNLQKKPASQEDARMRFAPIMQARRACQNKKRECSSHMKKEGDSDSFRAGLQAHKKKEEPKARRDLKLLQWEQQQPRKKRAEAPKLLGKPQQPKLASQPPLSETKNIYLEVPSLLPFREVALKKRKESLFPAIMKAQQKKTMLRSFFFGYEKKTVFAEKCYPARYGLFLGLASHMFRRRRSEAAGLMAEGCPKGCFEYVKKERA
jgi:hypothetical protein